LDREGWILYRQRVGEEDGAGGKPLPIGIAQIATSQWPKDAHYPFRLPAEKAGMPTSAAWSRSFHILSIIRWSYKVLKTFRDWIRMATHIGFR
jgi:hypothetical protein